MVRNIGKITQQIVVANRKEKNNWSSVRSRNITKRRRISVLTEMENGNSETEQLNVI